MERPVEANVATRRETVVGLAERVRELIEAMVTSEVPIDDLESAGKLVEEAAQLLSTSRRSRAELASVDDLSGGIRMFNPISGAAGPLAPPLVIEDTAEGAVGRATLGVAYEGHFMYAHGGVTAMLLDQTLGMAAIRHAHPSVTTRLVVRYRKPVPVTEPLVVTAVIEGMEGRRVTLRGTVCTEADPEVVLAEGEAWFVKLSSEHATAMFGSDQLHGGG